jgi:hypothetical protein
VARKRSFGEMVAIVGSRHWPDRQAVFDYVDSLSADAVVVTGCAPDGVDRWAREAAKMRGRILVVVYAPWLVHGKKAGMMRNPVVAHIAERLKAFRGVGKSNGTDDVTRWAEDFERPFHVEHAR